MIAIIGLSLENRSFAFQREGNSFVARYRVSLSLKREGAPPVDLAREEVVRVSTFQETQRADESVLFQQVLRIVPGAYKVTATVRDASSTSESSASAEYTAPSFGPSSYSAPILTYQATGRGNLADPVTLVLNPRGAVGYGSDTLLAYVEGYGFTEPSKVPFQVLDEQEHAIYSDSLRFRGGREVESQVVRLAPDSVSLGELRIVVGSKPERSTSALVSFTQAWVVTNFEEMLDLLRYFGHDEQIAAMRRAPGRRARADVARVLRGHRSQHRDAGERGAQPVLRPGQPGQPALQGRGPARLADRPRARSSSPWARRTKASRAPRGPRAASSGGPISPTGWRSTSRTRPASAGSGSPRGRGRSTSGSCPGCGGKARRRYAPCMTNHTPPRLYLIDGYALIYRAFFAMIARPLRTSKGENTSAAWGVVNFLMRLREKYKPDYVAWINDAGTSFRAERYPGVQVHPREARR